MQTQTQNVGQAGAQKSPTGPVGQKPARGLTEDEVARLREVSA